MAMHSEAHQPSTADERVYRRNKKSHADLGAMEQAILHVKGNVEQ